MKLVRCDKGGFDTRSNFTVRQKTVESNSRPNCEGDLLMCNCLNTKMQDRKGSKNPAVFKLQKVLCVFWLLSVRRFVPSQFLQCLSPSPCHATIRCTDDHMHMLSHHSTIRWVRACKRLSALSVCLQSSSWRWLAVIVTWECKHNWTDDVCTQQHVIIIILFDKQRQSHVVVRICLLVFRRSSAYSCVDDLWRRRRTLLFTWILRSVSRVAMKQSNRVNLFTKQSTKI